MSWDRTDKILFKPFILRKWVMLGIIVLLAGQAAGFNLNAKGNKAEFEKLIKWFTSPEKAVRDQISSSGFIKQAAGEAVITGFAASKDQDPQNIRSAPIFRGPEKAVFLVLIIGAISLFLGLFIFLWMWVNANFSFVFIESVVKNDASLRIPFHKNKAQGGSYLGWNIAFSLAALLLLGGIIAQPLIKIAKSGMFASLAAFDIVNAFAIITPYIMPLAASIAVFILISLIVVDFILPIMYKKKTGILNAWSVFLGLLRKNSGDILLYFLVKLGLAILAILVSIILLIAGIIISLLIGGITWLFGWLIYLIIPHAAKGIALAVLLGIGFCILFILGILFALLFLPIPMFFRIFPMCVLGSIDENLDVFEPEAEAAAEENISQYKKSMALVWFTVLSPLLAIILILAAIAIPYLMTTKMFNITTVQAAAAGKTIPAKKFTAYGESFDALRLLRTRLSRTTPEDDGVTVYLLNGNSFKAKTGQESGDNISFVIDGGTFTLPRSDILRIER